MRTKSPRIKACRDLRSIAKIVLELSETTIRCVEDLWSSEKIRLVINPEPKVLCRESIGEIIIRSFEQYLRRPGHVLLPDGMVSNTEFEEERHNPLLRVHMLWEYWHGSKTLNCKRTRTVSVVP